MLFALGCALGLLISAPLCPAASASVPTHFDAELTGGLVGIPDTYGFLGYRLGLAAHYRALEPLRPGAYLDHFQAATTSADPGYVLGYQLTRLGAGAEPISSSVVPA